MSVTRWIVLPLLTKAFYEFGCFKGILQKAKLILLLFYWVALTRFCMFLDNLDLDTSKLWIELPSILFISDQKDRQGFPRKEINIAKLTVYVNLLLSQLDNIFFCIHLHIWMVYNRLVYLWLCFATRVPNENYAERT